MRKLMLILLQLLVCIGIAEAATTEPASANLAIVWTGSAAGVSARIGFSENPPNGYNIPVEITSPISLALNRVGSDLIGSASFYVFWQILGNQNFELVLRGPDGMQASGTQPIDYEVLMDGTSIISSEDNALTVSLGYITDSVADYEELSFQVVLDSETSYSATNYTAELSLLLKVI